MLPLASPSPPPGAEPGSTRLGSSCLVRFLLLSELRLQERELKGLERPRLAGGVLVEDGRPGSWAKSGSSLGHTCLRGGFSTRPPLLREAVGPHDSLYWVQALSLSPPALFPGLLPLLPEPPLPGTLPALASQPVGSTTGSGRHCPTHPSS